MGPLVRSILFDLTSDLGVHFNLLVRVQRVCSASEDHKRDGDHLLSEFRVGPFMFVVKPSDICIFGVSGLDGHIIVIIRDIVSVGVGSHLQTLGIFSIAIGNSEVLLDPLSSLFLQKKTSSSIGLSVLPVPPLLTTAEILAMQLIMLHFAAVVVGLTVAQNSSPTALSVWSELKIEVCSSSFLSQFEEFLSVSSLPIVGVKSMSWSWSVVQELVAMVGLLL